MPRALVQLSITNQKLKGGIPLYQSWGEINTVTSLHLSDLSAKTPYYALYSNAAKLLHIISVNLKKASIRSKDNKIE